MDQAAPPELPECLQGDSPVGCAALPEAPIFSDWECPEGWDSVSVPAREVVLIIVSRLGLALDWSAQRMNGLRQLTEGTLDFARTRG